MEKIQHRTLQVNGINMHVAEIGGGDPAVRPPVLFLHGFPELWYSWRHQMLAAAAAGYHAIAPDLRGYGDSEAPPSAESYTVFHVVGDLIGLLDRLELHLPVFVVGHDWGAIIAWHLSLFRPDRVKALVNLSVAFMPRSPHIKPIDALRLVCGDDLYFCRFQDPTIEEEFASVDKASWFKTVFGNRDSQPSLIPKVTPGGTTGDAPVECPSWLSEEDISYYVDKINKSGITGGLNYYRAMDRNWELTAPWTGAQVKVPVKFVAGDLDLALHLPGVMDYINDGGFKKDVPLLKEVVIIEGAAHFVQQEKADEISKHILDFVATF